MNLSCLSFTSERKESFFPKSNLKRWTPLKHPEKSIRSVAVEASPCKSGVGKSTDENLRDMAVTLQDVDSQLAPSASAQMYPAHCSGVTGRCSDGSYSYPQPPPGGFCDSEGRCGQTAAANIFSSYCSKEIHPNELIDVAWDMTPGTRPGTLVTLLNTIFEENKCYENLKWTEKYSNQSDFISDLYEATHSKSTLFSVEAPKKRPVAVLVDIESPHWVTVVGVLYNEDRCHVIINSEGQQYLESCSQFTKDATLGNTTAGICSQIVCSSYSIIAPVERKYSVPNLAQNTGNGKGRR